ncbi:hypothetical protein OG819_49935 [Streptomyces sp. NBC_01549]|uniref:hypothetical protein n=1 Tax=Streptomyces sp. NBC_01549 TaxID=2975874 RepID=UPI002254EC72|nr:hypothetical protein [Streptomyces sp. NBC_01549]MCX4597412.1 hypothetical protein [Streptomyces sp. NBC_01549]
MLHGSAEALALVVGGSTRRVVDGVVGAVARDLAQGRSLADPLVLLACYAARAVQEVADAAGRLVWATSGVVQVGAEPIDLDEPSAGEKVRLAIRPGSDGAKGGFVSAWPQGAAGDLARFATRRRFPGPGECGWLVEQLAPEGVGAPAVVRPTRLRGERLLGWSYFDRRDRASRARTLASDHLGAAYVSWTANEDYRPGSARQRGEGRESQPWHVREHGLLPFDVARVLVVPVYFAHGRFLVYDQQTGTSYREEPVEFGRRLARDRAALAPEHCGEVLLLTDFAPVSAQVARAVARGFGGRGVITADRPGVLSVRGEPATGRDGTCIALLPWGEGRSDPVWTSTDAHGGSHVLGGPELPRFVMPSALGARLPGTVRARASLPPASLDAAPVGFHDAPVTAERSQDAVPGTGTPPVPESSAADRDRLAGDPAGRAPHGGEEPGPRPVLLGEVRVHSLAHAHAVPAAELRTRVDTALKGVDEQSRRVVAKEIGKLLGAAVHPVQTHVDTAGAASHGDHGGHGPREQEQEWAEALLRGLRIGRDDALVHIAFAPSKAPAVDELEPFAARDPAVTDGTSKYVEVSNSEERSDLINIGAGVVLETFVYESTKHVGVGLGVHFIPRKQLEVSHEREVRHLDGSRLMDSPRGTYRTGTDVTVVVQRADGSQVTGVVHVPEHEVEYSVVSSLTKPAEAGSTEIRRIAAPERLLDHPFGVTKIDPEPVLRAIGGALLSAGYTGNDAAHVVHEVAEEVFNSEQAQLVNHSLFDSTYRSGLIEGHHFLGNVRIALELVSVRRAPDITGDDAPPLRMDVGYAVETSHERSHGYDVPGEVAAVLRLPGPAMRVVAGGFGFELTDTYTNAVVEAHGAKFAARFGGGQARYEAAVQAVVTIDSRRGNWTTDPRKPFYPRKRVEGPITVDDINAEIVVPLSSAADFERDISTRRSRTERFADHLETLYAHAEPLGRSPEGGAGDGAVMRSADNPLQDARPGAMRALLAPGTPDRYLRGLLPTALRPIRSRLDLVEAVPVLLALAQEGTDGERGGIQLIVQDPELAEFLREQVAGIWDDEAAGRTAVNNALAALRMADGELRRLSSHHLLTLLATHPLVALADDSRVLISRHNPHDRKAREYVVHRDGRVRRGARTSPHSGSYADDVRTLVSALNPGGATWQLITRSGMGSAVVPSAPGIGRVLRAVENALLVMMDSRTPVDEGLFDTRHDVPDHRQGTRIRTEMMRKLGTELSSAKMRVQYDRLARSNLRVTVTVKGQQFWNRPRHFVIEVNSNLLGRLDGNVPAVGQDVSVDLQTEGTLGSATESAQETVGFVSFDATVTVEVVPLTKFSLTDSYTEAEGGKEKSRELSTAETEFRRTTTASGLAALPRYDARYGIAITEFDSDGKAIRRVAHSVDDEIAPVVPMAFKPPTEGLPEYLEGLDEFWPIDEATAAQLKARRYRFDITGTTGVSLHLANIERLVDPVLAMIRSHDDKHGIHRTFAERMALETQVRDYMDNAYFGSHLSRLVGNRGMPGMLPYLRHWFPRPRNWQRGKVRNIKSSLNISLFFVPTSSPSAKWDAEAREAKSKATSMSRNIHEAVTEQRHGKYGQFFHSTKMNPEVHFAGNSFGTPGPQARFAVVASNERYKEHSVEGFTMEEVLKEGIDTRHMSAVVEISFNTRFSKNMPVSSTGRWFLGDGTSQLEMPTALHDHLLSADPLERWTPVLQRPDATEAERAAVRRPLSAPLAYDTAHAHTVIAGAEIASIGGVAGWVARTLVERGLIDARFMTASTDPVQQKITAAYDESALAGQLPELMSTGIPVHLDRPLLGDRRLTVLLKGTSLTGGPQYVRSSKTGTTTFGGTAVVSAGRVNDKITTTGIGLVGTGEAVLDEAAEAAAVPQGALRFDRGQDVGKEQVGETEDLRRITGTHPDDTDSPTTDLYSDWIALDLQISVDYRPLQPLRTLTAASKKSHAALSYLMAPRPDRTRLDVRTSGFTLDDEDGYRTFVLDELMPGSVLVPMTMDRSLTQPVTAPAVPKPAAPTFGYTRRVATPAPSTLNQALASVVHPVNIETANVAQHARFAGTGSNTPDRARRTFTTSKQYTEKYPTKEASFSLTGNKGRAIAQSTARRVARNKLPLVLLHTYDILTEPGTRISYGADVVTARPLPVDSVELMTALNVDGFNAETITSTGNVRAQQGSVDPTFAGNASNEAEIAVPHLAIYTTTTPSSLTSKHVEDNRRTRDRFIPYSLTVRDVLHSRGITYELTSPGHATVFIRHSDAVELATRFPGQFIHPDTPTAVPPHTPSPQDVPPRRPARHPRPQDYTR